MQLSWVHSTLIMLSQGEALGAYMGGVVGLYFNVRPVISVVPVVERVEIDLSRRTICALQSRANDGSWNWWILRH